MLEEIIISIGDYQPGVLAEIGELLGKEGVNIETLAGSNFSGAGVLHIVVDDGEEAGEVLRANGYEVSEIRSVMTATVDDQPGEFGSFCRRLADAGVDVSAVYVAKRGGGETELIFAVDDIETAQSV
jgi:hypothetical protein